MKLEEVVDYQNDLLRIADFTTIRMHCNGLQMQNSGTVTKVAVAVDACEAVLRDGRLAGCGSPHRASRPALGRLADGYRSRTIAS